MSTVDIAVGDIVWLPKCLPGNLQLPRALLAQALMVEEEITGKPGRVVSIEDGWAMVLRPGWGEFGAPVGDLVLALAAPRCLCEFLGGELVGPCPNHPGAVRDRSGWTNHVTEEAGAR